MRKLLGFSIFALVLSAFVQAEQAPSLAEWRVKSVETQAGTADLPVLKSSAKANQLAKSANRQIAPALIRKVRSAQNTNSDFSIYDASVLLRTDSDYDGYYYHFDLNFDADTVFNQARVYARLYLGVGNTFQEYYTTSKFVIKGDSTEDDLRVESELLQGFPARNYEILIELYDTYNNQLVAVYDGNNDADLNLLSLESKDFEQVYVEPVVVVTEEGGGSVTLFSLLVGAGLLFGRMITRRSKEAI